MSSSDGPARLPRWQRCGPTCCALLAVILALPALGSGLMGDDWVHRGVLLHLGSWQTVSALTHLFSFVPGGAVTDELRDWGVLPWWSSPDLRVALFRPLAAATHVLDYALWPNSFVLQHAHSLGWYALCVWLAARLFQQVNGRGVVAAAAGLLFAVCDAHAMPAGWLANRNALVALAAGATVVLLHLAWRRSGRPGLLALAVLGTGVGLLCGEAALGALAYVAAWELTMVARPWRRRLLALAPYGVVVVLWRLLYDALGYGSHGSALYVDPGSQPLLFARALVERAPLLLAGQWLAAPIDLWILASPAARSLATVAAIAAVAGIILLLRPLRREPLARFWAVGMTLAVVPLCAAFPMDRLLIFAGLGGFGLLAMLAASRPRGWRRAAVVVLLVLHGPAAALLLAARTALLPQFGILFSAAARQAPAGPEVAGQTFVFVNGNDFPVAYCILMRFVQGTTPAPRRVALLASMADTNRVAREDERTLLVTPERGFLSFGVDRLLADANRAFAVGERVEAPDFTVEIRAVTADRRPAAVAFRFVQPLEDSRLRWLYWQDGRLQPFSLPSPGETVTTERNDFRRLR